MVVIRGLSRPVMIDVMTLLGGDMREYEEEP